MLENKLNINKNILVEVREQRQENNKNYDNTTQFTFKRKKIATFKSKKEPLPMKLRALPESFWQQPNEPAQHLPGTIYPELPVISANEDNSLSGTTYITNNEIVSTANTELLFSLFSVIETNQTNTEKCQMSLIRRGRPKKASILNKNVLRDKDPCLISTVTEALLPLLPERKKNTLKHSLIEQQAFLTLSFSTDQSAITTPPGQSYSHLLSEVVVRL